MTWGWIKDDRIFLKEVANLKNFTKAYEVSHYVLTKAKYIVDMHKRILANVELKQRIWRTTAHIGECLWEVWVVTVPPYTFITYQELKGFNN